MVDVLNGAAAGGVFEQLKPERTGNDLGALNGGGGIPGQQGESAVFNGEGSFHRHSHHFTIKPERRLQTSDRQPDVVEFRHWLSPYYKEPLLRPAKKSPYPSRREREDARQSGLCARYPITCSSVDASENAALRAARAAGAVHIARFGKTSFKGKTSFLDLVTEADGEAEAAAVSTLHRAFPEHAILSEEGGGIDQPSQHRW